MYVYNSQPVFFKTKNAWVNLYLPLLLWIQNSFIKSSKRSKRDIHNYLQAYSEPCHLSKIELFPVVNQWESLNISTKKLHLGCLTEPWMPLCVLTFYLMAKKDILRLGKSIDQEDKYTRSVKNCHL